jgi:hypothetical protein
MTVKIVLALDLLKKPYKGRGQQWHPLSLPFFIKSSSEAQGEWEMLPNRAMNGP